MFRPGVRLRGALDDALNHCLYNASGSPYNARMKRMVMTAVFLIIVAAASAAWGNECYTKAVSFQSVPHDRPSQITLTADRVQDIKGDLIIYDLGRELIAIRADSFAARRFVRDVVSGRCSARETFRIEPIRQSPFNTKFSAVNPH